MDINLETLHEEKRGLQADFDKLGGNIKQVEVDLAQMKANLSLVAAIGALAYGYFTGVFSDDD